MVKNGGEGRGVGKSNWMGNLSGRVEKTSAPMRGIGTQRAETADGHFKSGPKTPFNPSILPSQHLSPFILPHSSIKCGSNGLPKISSTISQFEEFVPFFNHFFK
jgi:hypothetical protein